MSEQTKIPSVLRFEQAVAAKDYELACGELLEILDRLDTNFGGIYDIEINFPSSLTSVTMMKERAVYLCTRMATAISTLFSDKDLVISQNGATRFLMHQRWIAMIFASSPYVHADHVLQTYNTNPDKSPQATFLLENTTSALVKFCILYLPESEIAVNLDALWAASPQLCASLCYTLQSSRFIGTQAAFSKRSAVLQWFADKLAEFGDLTKLPANITHDVYMHCSYDVASNKHDIKRGVNSIIRQYLLKNDWQDRDISSLGKANGKPVMVVLLEHFHSSHSIYRTHSTSMIAAREHFYLVGLGGDKVDQAGQDVFDEFFVLEQISVPDKLRAVKKVCDQFNPAVFYMPSIGMDLTTIFASNTRLAPIQAVALGHPATTHSEFIEYVVVEDDYVGSEKCFSEELIRLPKDALPYVPSALAPTKIEYKLRENPEVVNIGIAATTMKLNPYFLEALKVIAVRAKVPVHFHFALGQSMGVTHPYVERFIKSYLGDMATCHPHAPYETYMQMLCNCDMMLNPFPFGNTNGIIDMVTLGLVGICKTGDEVHEHIDEGLFKRLGLPKWLIANTVDEYVERAVRLAENHKERLALRRHIIENNGLQTLFSGDPTPMGNEFLLRVQNWAKANNVAFEFETKPTIKPAKAKKPSKAKTDKAAQADEGDKPKRKVGRPKKVVDDAGEQPAKKPATRRKKADS